jgi:hypothetical protein
MADKYAVLHCVCTWGTMGAGGRKRRISFTTVRVYVIRYSTSPVMTAFLSGRTAACSSRTCRPWKRRSSGIARRRATAAGDATQGVRVPQR